MVITFFSLHDISSSLSLSFPPLSPFSLLDTSAITLDPVVILSIEANISSNSVEVRWQENEVNANSTLTYFVSYDISVADIILSSGNSSVVPEENSTIVFYVITDSLYILPGVTVSVDVEVSDDLGNSEVNSTSILISGGMLCLCHISGFHGVNI